MEEAAEVECYSGSRYGERPLRFLRAGQWYEIEEVDASWRTPSALHFRVRTVDDDCYELAYRERVEQWFIVPVSKTEKEHP